MANKFQIKRSTSNASVTGLSAGELAFTQASNTLFIGAPDGISGSIPIGTKLNYGVLTANAVFAANSTSGIDKIITANLTVISIVANGSLGTTGQILYSDAGGNVYWASVGAVGVNTAAQYTWSNTQTFTNTVTFNSTINGTANNALYLSGNSVSDLRSYADTSSANAYNQATSYTDTATGTAYSNAVSYAGTIAGTAYSNATSYADTKAGTAYSNAVSVAATDASNKAANAYSNAMADTLSRNSSYTGNSSFGGTNTIISSNLSVTGSLLTNLVPAGNGTVNLGSAANRFGTLYLAGSTIVLGNTSLSDSADGFTVNTASITGILKSSGNTVLGDSTSDIITVNAGVTGNLMPTSNGTYHLGNNTMRWAQIHAQNVHSVTGIFDGSVIVGGDILVTGNLVTQNVQSVIISDPLIYLAGNNYVSDAVDIGFVGNYYDGATQRHTGVIRHAATDEYYIFKGYTPELDANNVVDINHASFKLSALHADLISGALSSNGSALTITANSTVSAAIVANSLTLTTALAASYGGTGQTSYDVGDLLYASGTTALSKLSIPGSAANGQVLQIVNNLPAYGTLDGGTF